MTLEEAAALLRSHIRCARDDAGISVGIGTDTLYVFDSRDDLDQQLRPLPVLDCWHGFNVELHTCGPFRAWRA